MLQSAVNVVDREMSGIRDAGRVKARERIAVLAALNIAYRLAEHPVAPPTPATAPASATAAPATTPPGPDSASLKRLLAQLDAALQDDGLLL